MRKIFFLLIILALIPSIHAYTIGTAATNDNTILPFTERGSFLLVNLNSQNPDPVSPGDIVELRFKVENEGLESVDDLIFELLPKYPFTLMPDDNGARDVGTVLSRQTEDDGVILYYKIKVDENAIDGDNPIKLRYYTQGSWIILDDFNIRVQSEAPELLLDSVVTQPADIIPGKPTQLKITLKNSANSDLRDIKVKLSLDSTSFSPYQSSNEKTISRLGSKQTAELSFDLIADGDAASKIHKINAIMDYSDTLGNDFTKNTTLGLIVNDLPDFILNLEETEIYQANKEGNVVFSISNIGSSDIKYTTIEVLESDDYVVLSSYKYYIGNLEPDDFDTAQFKLHVSKVVEQLPVLVQIQYKDNYNNMFTKNQTVPLRLYSPDEAVRFGLAKSASFVPLLIGVMFMILLAIFWVIMLMDAIRRPMKRFNRIIWLIILIGTLVIGAAVYYFLVKRKR